MAYKNQIKCTGCGKSIPDVPEDSTSEERLCNECYDKEEKRDSRCKGCKWEPIDSGCNVGYDASTCVLNREFKSEKDTKEKLKIAVDKAVMEFWLSIAESFPEIKGGDQDPITAHNFDLECKKVVQKWLVDNSSVDGGR